MQVFRRTVVFIAAGLASLPAGRAYAQSTATAVPGSTYGAGPLKSLILGKGWRELWETPVTVPVIDIDTFAGGLKIDKQGGGFQTVTLHMTEKNGWKEWRFRSVDKFPELHLPPAIAGTFLGSIIEDQTGNLFPAAGVILPPFMEAIGALHVTPQLYVMKDSPGLGKYRETFKGMLGTMELKGEEAPDDKPGFAGSNKIKDTDAFLEDMRKSRAHRLDERELLAVRLVDFLINDPDRTPDNLDWARFGDAGNYRWRPIARDRDRAFTNGSGALNLAVVQRVYPKFTKFNSKFGMRGLMTPSYAIDRPLLQRLTKQDFADVARKVQASISDEVIATSISMLPKEWAHTERVTKLRETLIARRAGLFDAAMKFYAELAAEPDIYLTADNERADIVRHENGQVTVTVSGALPAPKVVADVPNPVGGATRVMAGEVGPSTPFYYQRTFLPSETKEIRVYLGKGNDTAVVRGASNDAILVRVIGEEGDDVLADSVRAGAEFFYDSDGTNQFVKRGTHVSEKPWTAPLGSTGFTIGGAWRPDWGERTGWRPHFKYAEGAGLILGAGPRITSYGFRHLPYHWQAGAALLYGTGNGRFGVTTTADWRAENSPLGFAVAARATELDGFRFYGYGNDTPNIGRELSLVQQRVIAAEPSLTWQVGWRKRESVGKILHDFSEGSPYEKPDTLPTPRRAVVGMIKVGPLFTWTDPQPAVAGPLSSAGGGNAFAHYGAGFSVDLDGTDVDPMPTLGWRLRAKAAGYPIGIHNDGFTTSSGTASAYLPLGLGKSTVAFRVGGALASGDYPAQYAAFVGGSSTVRGYSWQRFAGDVAASGSTELRVPVGTLNFVVRSDVGLIGLVDAGRVWLDEQSNGGWHTSYGGGVWLGAFGKALSVTYARGEVGRFYLKSGLPF